MTAERADEQAEITGPLLDFIRFADQLQAIYERAHRPAYAETCTCGASVEVGQRVPAAELRRARNDFIGRHVACTRANREDRDD